MGPQLGFCVFQGSVGFKDLKWFPLSSIGLQQCLCHVSSLASQVCSVNNSDDWKSTIFGKKSTMVNI